VKTTGPSIRIVAWSTALVLAAALAAAGCRRETETPSSGGAPASSQAPQTGPATTPETPSDAAVAQMLAPWTGDLDGMIERT
jgi:hypothetical protein